MGKTKEEDIADKMVVVGGVIPQRDVGKLKALGVQGVFPGGTPFAEIVTFLNEKIKRR